MLHLIAIGMNGTYAAYTYNNEGLHVVESHDPSEPLFLCEFYWLNR
jgi:hypothetical protein